MTQESTCLLEGRLANHSQSQGSGPDYLTIEETSLSNFAESCLKNNPSGSFGKMSPESFQVTKGKTSGQSSQRLMKSGMASHGEFLTLNTSEWPSDAVECLLSDILETGDHLQEFSLSPKACLGILRRAEKRGKELPALLKKALEQQCQEGKSSPS